MRAWIFSDIHDGFSNPPIPEADVAIVAGDVGTGLCESLEWLASTVRPYMPVVFVAGNHEFYGGTFERHLRQGRELAARADVALLENGATEIAGVIFAGATLWTDYLLHGLRHKRASMDAAFHGINDHRRIAIEADGVRRPFLPADAAERNATSVEFLGSLVRRDRRKPLVVVTHHSPSGMTLKATFKGHPLNPAFGSSLEGLIESVGAELWVHGHTHACADVRIGNTRVMCNPLGYGSENPVFDPELLVEISEGCK